MSELLYLLMVLSTIYVTNAIRCGHPGRPAYGEPLQTGESYYEGQAVTYTCKNGYYMVGTIIRRCLPNGTWTGHIPVCDTTLSPSGFTSSSEALSLYPPEMAVDGNKRSCFYSNRRKPRWWRMDMNFKQTVLSVSITVPFASSEHHFTVYVIAVNGSTTNYQRCASFRGIFSSQAMILSCGNIKGITGSVLHIEDESPHFDYFALCEVEVYVRKDYYECGRPETPTNGTIDDVPDNKINKVKYKCKNGYKLEGPQERVCMRNGQWSDSQPICREINCPKPMPIDNGYYRLITQTTNKPVLGSKVVFGCKPGFHLSGINDTQYCQENGTWTVAPPECFPVDCGHPSDNMDYLGGRFKLLNSSTTFASMAELMCFSGKKSGIIIRCDEDGSWTDLDATCIYNKDLRGLGTGLKSDPIINYYTANTSDSTEDNNSNTSIATILASGILAVLLVLILLVFLLFKKKIIGFKWSAQPIGSSRRPSWALEALRSTNIQIRKPFRFQPNCSSKSHSTTSHTNSSIKSVSSKLENVYEEIQNFASNPITDETEDKIRRAAIIAAELAVINEQKQSQLQNPLSKPLSSPIGLYAKVDLIQKHKNRLLREQKFRETNGSDDSSDGMDGNYAQHLKLYHTISNPEFEAQSCSTNFETIRVSSLDLSKSHLLKDNMIFVGHPGVTNCDNLSQLSKNKSDVKHIYSISS